MFLYFMFCPLSLFSFVSQQHVLKPHQCLFLVNKLQGVRIERIAFCFLFFVLFLILFERKNEFDHQKKKKKKKLVVVMFVPRLRYCTVVSINLNSKGSDHGSVCLFACLYLIINSHYN